MRIKLTHLTIANFKGVTEFNATFKPDRVIISGANGTGKSTIADAFYWLFDNANAEQRSNFNIIALDPAGVAKNHVDAEACAELKIDDKTIMLKKIHRQVWVKRRGSETEEHTGHTTDYYIDDVPLTKTEYHNRLGEIIAPEMLRSLSDVKYFCGSSNLNFRRKILIDLIGAVDLDEDQELSKILNGRSIDDYKSILNKQKKEIDKSLNDIPIRIDEVLSGMPNVTHLKLDELGAQLDEIDAAIELKRADIAGISGAGLAAEKKRQLLELENKSNRIKNMILDDFDKKRTEIKKNIEEIERKISLKNTARFGIEKQIEEITKILEDNAGRRRELVAEYENINKKKFMPKTTCHACGQVLTEDKMEEQLSSFNAMRAERLRKINEKGAALFKAYKANESGRGELLEQSALNRSVVESLEKNLADANISLMALSKQMADEITVETRPIQDRIASISKDLEKGDADITPEKERLKKELSNLEKMKSEVERDMLKLTQAEKTKRRVKALESEKKELGVKYERLLYEYDLIEKAEHMKRKFIEQNISRKFDRVQWKLFEPLVNGGCRDICEAMIDGVPYSSDLNTGARVNVGIDVINTLSRHYNVFCPVFVDNAESVTDLVGSACQMIRLVAVKGEGLKVS